MRSFYMVILTIFMLIMYLWSGFYIRPEDKEEAIRKSMDSGEIIGEDCPHTAERETLT